MRRLLALAALLLGLSPIAAEAQSSCQYIAYGAVLTAAQWNSCFQQKADQVVGGYLPLSGGTMTGELITAASATTSAGLNVIPGTAPTSPNNGDLWATGVGFYVQIGGATYNLLAGATGVTSLGNPGGNSSLTLAGTGSGPWTGAVTIKLNLGNANAWSVLQTFNGGATVTGSFTATGLVTNADLANSTISGIALGSNLDTLTFGTHLAAGGTSYNGSAGVTITSDATNANTASTIVARDGSGNFSAGTITASLTGYASLDLALTGGTLSGLTSVDLGSGTGAPAADTGTGLAVYGADATTSRMETTAFGATAAVSLRSSLGTRGSPSALTAGTLIASYNVHGYDGNIWTSTAYGAIHTYAQANWTSTSHETKICFATTPTTSSATNADSLCQYGDGSVSITTASATAFAVGLNGVTNPALNVDASTASQVAGLDVVGAVHNGTVAVKVIDSSGNTNLTINALGSGTIGIGSVSTGGVTITPATNVIGALTLGTQQTTQGSLVLSNTAAGAFATTIMSSNSATASWTLTLPTTAGTNGYILSTNGSGVTSWIANTGGTGCTVSGVTTGYVYNNGSSGCSTSSTFTTNGSTDTETATLNLTNAGAGFNHSFSSSSNIYDIINNSGSGHVGLEIEGNSGGTQAILSLGGTLGTNVFYILTQGSSGGPIIFQTNSTNALQLDNNANVQVYNQFYSTAAVTVASAAGATLDDIAIKAETTTVTGTTTVTALSKSHFYRPTFTDSSAATLTTASTVTIDNSPNCTGSLTCTNQWALNVVAGATNLGGTLTLNGSTLTFGGNFSTSAALAVTAGSTGQLAFWSSGTAIGGENIASALTAGGEISITGTTNATIAAIVQPRGRLTLVSGTPVMTATESGKTTVYYDCYHGGNQVSVYNGTTDITLAIGACEISTLLKSSGTGVLNSAGVFDVWAVNVSSTLTLCIATNGSGGGWASDSGSNTSRGTGYSALDTTTRPYITNANAITHCYNGATDEGSISANRATYLGTIGTDSGSAGQVSWTYGASGNAPTAGVFNIWNAYNRVNVAQDTFGDTTNSWTYSTATTWRQAHGDTTLQDTYTVGIAEDAIQAVVLGDVISGGAAACNVGTGVDSNTAISGGGQFSTFASSVVPASARYDGVPGVGQHVISAIEWVSTAASSGCNFFGQNNVQLGLSLDMKM